jgi:uncharacterized circularly permuted ATP-grasp superfamily protein
VKWVPETHAFDEAFDRTAVPRPHYRGLVSTLESFTLTEIGRRERLQKISLVDQGITFTVYGEKEGIERISPSTSCHGSSRPASGSASRPASSSG